MSGNKKEQIKERTLREAHNLVKTNPVKALATLMMSYKDIVIRKPVQEGEQLITRDGMVEVITLMNMALFILGENTSTVFKGRQSGLKTVAKIVCFAIKLTSDKRITANIAIRRNLIKALSDAGNNFNLSYSSFQNAVKMTNHMIYEENGIFTTTQAEIDYVDSMFPQPVSIMTPEAFVEVLKGIHHEQQKKHIKKNARQKKQAKLLKDLREAWEHYQNRHKELS